MADAWDQGGTYTLAEVMAFRGRVRRCEACQEPMPAGRRGFTCSPECSRFRTRQRNRERAGRWRENAKAAMADRLHVFSDAGPPPMAWLNLLATVPAGSRLTLDLPDGSAVSWFRP
jgi:hypothetical protein